MGVCLTFVAARLDRARLHRGRPLHRRRRLHRGQQRGDHQPGPEDELPRRGHTLAPAGRAHRGRDHERGRDRLDAAGHQQELPRDPGGGVPGRSLAAGPAARDEARARRRRPTAVARVGGPGGHPRRRATSSTTRGRCATASRRGSAPRRRPAPQATLMSLVTKGILTQQLPWGLVLLGRLHVDPHGDHRRARARLRRRHVPAPREHDARLPGRARAQARGLAAGLARPNPTPAPASSTARASWPAARSWASWPSFSASTPELEGSRPGARLRRAGACRPWPSSASCRSSAWPTSSIAPRSRPRRRRRPHPSSQDVKVAFIGTHGVGKTTLCYDLAGAAEARAASHVDMVKEVARLSPLPINRKTSLEAQTWILMTQVAEEIRSAAYHDVVVCDRSALDNYAYMALACGRQKPFERFVAHWMKTYDLLFKVPDRGGGVRGRHPRHRRVLHALDRRAGGQAARGDEDRAPARCRRAIGRSGARRSGTWC